MTAPRLRPTTLQALRFPLLVFALALCTSLASFAGCGLSTGGIPSADAGTACTTDQQCDDADACTTDTCGQGGICSHVPVADGPAPAADQIPGDCHTTVCKDGAPMAQVDDTDVPVSSNPCIKEECNMGVPLADNTANDGKPCVLGGSPAACISGVCTVSCMKAADCPDMGACTTASCDGATGTCMYANVSDGTPTPGAVPVVGDCVVHVCIGGKDTAEDDPSDVPAIPAALAGCADAVCTAGNPMNPLHTPDSVCSTYMGNLPGHCDATGHCVECVSDGDCPGPTDDCQHPACVSALCTMADTASGTVTSMNPPQIPGDCHDIVCDGVGGHHLVVNDVDAPMSGTVCITDTCSGGNVVQTDNPGVVCSMTNEKCSTTGLCGCQGNADCTAPQTCGGGGMPLFCGCTPKTCASLGKTCGGPFSDACSGMLGCNDGFQDGTESDVDCGGVAAGNSTCAVTCPNGKKCNLGSDCQSGFCADGVCCNSACTGAGFTCQACSAAAKGQGTDGLCGAVKAGADPHNQCPAGNKMSCMDAGGCNGSGSCTLYGSGTICVAATCMGPTTLVKAETCNGTGTCNMPAPPTQDCTPYLCSGGACTATCANDTQCASTAYCGGGQCHPKLATGTGTCSAADQCTSNICGTNGNCCAAACAAAPPCGLTGGCAAGTGACLNAASGTTCSKVVSCTNGATGGSLTTDTQCNGSGTCSSGAMMANCPGNAICSNGTTCNNGCGALGSGDAKCPSGTYCNGVAPGACVPKLGNGAATCAAGDQCTSGVCGSNGTCCAGTCTASPPCGTTTACAANTGACLDVAAGTACVGAGSCSGGTVTTDTQCDGMGACASGPMMMSCPGNVVVCNGNACFPGCGAVVTGDARCASTSYCDGNGPGSCQPRLADGAACTADDQCTDMVCGVNHTGFCCTAACANVGMTCGGVSCTSGVGNGGCNYPGPATSCGTASCSNGLLTGSACDSMGNCVLGSPNLCPGNRACQDGSHCLTSGGCGNNDMTGDMKCAQGFWCDGLIGGSCAAEQSMGALCNRDSQCTNGCCTTGPCTHNTCN